MKPTQGKCQDCDHWARNSGMIGHCRSIDDTTLGWWTGCCRWLEKTERHRPEEWTDAGGKKRLTCWCGNPDPNHS